MSRRKQANPKSLKLCIDALVEEQNKNATASAEPAQVKLKENLEDEEESDDSNDSVDQNQENKNVNIEKKDDDAELKLLAQKDDDCFFKNRTNNQINIENRKLNLKYSDEEIDVENLSADENNANSRSRSTSNSSIITNKSSSSSNSSFKSEHKNETSLNLLNNQSVKKRRQRYTNTPNTASLSNSNLQKQQNASILINGKRYYPLKFSCENCGLRYSDQSTLNTHKQNYCSKRNQTSTSSRSASSSSAQSANSSRSNSPNQLKQLSFDLQPDKANSNSSSSSSESNQPNETEQLIKTETIPKINSLNLIANEAKNENREVHLLKSIMYQCNYCLFQTDKKSAMNKHSRVHLPQKRKEMEEMAASACSPNSISSRANMEPDEQRVAGKHLSRLDEQQEQNKYAHSQEQTKQQNATDLNDRTKSYCSDCDIQFSSMKTYLHHRNNYCQKFKTIEAIVPVELSSNKPSMPAEKINNEKFNTKPNEPFKAKQNEPNKNPSLQLISPQQAVKISSNPEPPLSYIKTPGQTFLASNSEVLMPIKSKTNLVQQPVGLNSPRLLVSPAPAPPSAVRMGDLVYVPVYKLQKEPEMPKMSPLVEPIQNKLNLDSFYLNKLVARSEEDENAGLTRSSRSKAKDGLSKNRSPSSSLDSSKSSSVEAPLDLSIRNGLSEQQKSFIRTTPCMSDAINKGFTQEQLNLYLSNAFYTNNSPYSSKQTPLVDMNQLALLHSLNKSTNWSQGLKKRMLIDNESNDAELREEAYKSAHPAELIFKNLIEQQNKALFLNNNNNNSGHILYQGKTQTQAQPLLKMPFQPASHFPLPNYIQPQLHQTPTAENKIYHCTYCGQLFLKLKAFKRHQCVLNQSQIPQTDNLTMQSKASLYEQLVLQQQQQSENIKELVVNNSIDRPSSRPASSGSSSSEISTKHLDTSIKIPSPSLLIENTSKFSPRQQQQQQKIAVKSGGGKNLSFQDLVKLPSVINTLLKTYDVTTMDELKEYLNDENSTSLNSSDESIQKFSICTTCGYRGKTIRGVKQHGKSHLIEKEHFGIIEVKEKLFSLAYYSASDTDIQFSNGVRKTGGAGSFFALPQDLINGSSSKLFSFNKNGSNSDSNEEESSDEENKLDDGEAGCKIPLLLLKEENNSKKNEEASGSMKRSSEFVKSNADSCQQPLSKKARILEGHYNNQKLEQMQNESVHNKTAASSSNKADKSQTFCVKCNIQFQHVKSYLAHKSTYCKDS